MGLDWNPGNKPKPGQEEEFLRLYHALDDPKDECERKALLDQFEAVSIKAFETLGAPRVGRDAAATAWAREAYEKGERKKPFDEWIADLEGFYVLPLVPGCDGLPRYTNGYPGGYVEAYAFRAQFLRDCENILGDELLESAYVSKLPDELMAYGRALIARAETYATEKGIDLTAYDEDSEWTPDDDAHLLDVVRAAGRWCVFWAERGHFLDSYW